MLIVLAIAVPIIVIVFLVGQFGGRLSRSQAETKTISVMEREDVWPGRVAINLSGRPAHRVGWTSAGTLELYWTGRPVWTFALAVVLFPFGLLALLHTITHVGRFEVSELGPPGDVRIDGVFSQVAVDLVNRAIPD